MASAECNPHVTSRILVFMFTQATTVTGSYLFNIEYESLFVISIFVVSGHTLFRSLLFGNNMFAQGFIAHYVCGCLGQISRIDFKTRFTQPI